METIWTKGHSDVEARRKEILSYRNAFEELSKVLDKEWPEEIKIDYSEPGWTAHLAHNLGQREAFRRIKKLITLKEKD